jgi:CubicO group peptidase (beta-lactamase class C family)
MKYLSIFFYFLTVSASLFAQAESAISGNEWLTNNDFKQNSSLKLMDSLIVNNSYKEISSLVIAHKGKIIFENYYNNNTADTKHNTRSATKTITGTLIGTLIQNGKLKSVQEPASKYSKVKNLNNPDKRKSKITIEDLLTMSSILECNDWEPNSNGNEEKMYLIEDWVKFYWDLPIKGYPEWIAKPEDSKYGRSFSYCTAGVVVLGDVINTITGSLEKYADQVLFSKMGIIDYHWQMTPTGNPMAGGGLGLKSRDLLKMGQLYLNDGKWNGEQIIPADFVKKSVEPHAEVGMFDYEYGYLWWLSTFGKEQREKAYFMTGTGGNKVVVFPDLELVVVLTSTYFKGGMESHNQTARLLDEFIVPVIQGLKNK